MAGLSHGASTSSMAVSRSPTYGPRPGGNRGVVARYDACGATRSGHGIANVRAAWRARGVEARRSAARGDPTPTMPVRCTDVNNPAGDSETPRPSHRGVSGKSGPWAAGDLDAVRGKTPHRGGPGPMLRPPRERIVTGTVRSTGHIVKRQLQVSALPERILGAPSKRLPAV